VPCRFVATGELKARQSPYRRTESALGDERSPSACSHYPHAKLRTGVHTMSGRGGGVGGRFGGSGFLVGSRWMSGCMIRAPWLWIHDSPHRRLRLSLCEVVLSTAPVTRRACDAEVPRSHTPMTRSRWTLLGAVLSHCAACNEPARTERPDATPMGGSDSAAFDAAEPASESGPEAPDGAMPPSDAAVLVIDPRELEITAPR
jgi:hypothetical protein